MPVTLPLSVPALLFVVWKTESKKNPILKAARTVKPDGMFVNEDLAAETLLGIFSAFN